MHRFLIGLIINKEGFLVLIVFWDRRTGQIWYIDSRTNSPFFYKGAARGWDKKTISSALSKRHECQIELIEGWIPACFGGYENKQFAFADIDVDLYQATYDSLAFIYERMVKGGIILFDDYGFVMCAGARKAVDDFMLGKPEPVILIPTGQAILIKQ